MCLYVQKGVDRVGIFFPIPFPFEPDVGFIFPLPPDSGLTFSVVSRPQPWDRFLSLSLLSPPKNAGGWDFLLRPHCSAVGLPGGRNIAWWTEGGLPPERVRAPSREVGRASVGKDLT